jgi:V-type H+-transporting ATPase subunit a
MDFGIMNSLYNNMYFRDTLSTLWEFIPQMIFLNFIFGYLCILIIAKWVSGSLADLYHVMINMFLAPGSMDAQGQVFNGQGGLQVSCSCCKL